MGDQTFWAFCLLACVTVTSLVEGFQDRAKCPEEAIYYRLRCYQPVYRALTWAEAEIECQQLRSGGHLATFRTAAEERIVSSHFGRFSAASDAWIGMHAVRTPMKLIWEWIDGTSYNPGSPLWDNRAPNTSVSSAQCISITNIHSPENGDPQGPLNLQDPPQPTTAPGRSDGQPAAPCGAITSAKRVSGTDANAAARWAQHTCRTPLPFICKYRASI